MRLIDADALKDEMSKVFFNDNDDMRRIEELIDNAPTVESDCMSCKQYDDGYNYGLNIGYNKAKRKRPQGEWKLHGMIYYCSECGHECGESGDNFCGNCGADMRGGT